MTHKAEYVRHEWRSEHELSVGTVFHKIKGVILKIVRLLSFDGGGVFKSKQWPYY